MHTRSLIGAAVALIAASQVSAQVNYSETYDLDVASWTIVGGFVPGWASTAIATQFPCGGIDGSMHTNIYNTNTSATFTSPLLGSAVGGTITIEYNYKCVDFNTNTAVTSPWGSLEVSYGPTATGPWTSINVITDAAQSGTCTLESHTFSTIGDVYVQFAAERTAGDFDIYIDDVSVVETGVTACSGTPTPGNTEVTGEFCSVGDSVTLSLENATSGTGVTRAWFESADNVNFTPFGTGLEAETVSPAGPTYYRCDVTCAGGGTGSSTVVFVDYALPVPGDAVAVPAELCNAGDPIDLSLNGTLPASATFQWYDSNGAIVGATSATHTANPAAADVFFCEVTCGSNTVASLPVIVDFSAGAVFPQGFSATQFANCWSEVSIVGTQTTVYETESAYGIGTGSVESEFFLATAGDEWAHISPVFPATVAGDGVTFDVAGAKWTDAAFDTIILEESSDGGVTWSPVVTMTNAPGDVLNTGGDQGGAWTPAAADWSSLAYPLSVGTDRIRFHSIAGFGNRCYVDNVNIVSSPAAHIPYGVTCSPGYDVTAAPLPTLGSTVTYTVSGMPDNVPPLGVHIGLLVVSFAPGPGITLAVAGGDPTCVISINALDATIALITGPGGPATADVAIPYPNSAPPGAQLFFQAVNLVPATATNPAGLVTSSALESVLGF